MTDLSFVVTVQKGDLIEQDDVIKIMGIFPNEITPGGIPPEVQLAGMIEKELHRIGRYWTVKAFKGCVKILTDIEAFEHNKKRHRCGVNKFKRAIAGMSGVDLTKFNANERKEFDMANRKITAQYLALKSARPSPTEMIRPALVGR